MRNPSLREATVAERFSGKYRIMWNQNGGEEASYHPPMTPEKYAQAFLGFPEGTQVDAFVSGLGWASGYQEIYPTEVEGMDFRFLLTAIPLLETVTFSYADPAGDTAGKQAGVILEAGEKKSSEEPEAV